jgi:hypothetical protein
MLSLRTIPLLAAAVLGLTAAPAVAGGSHVLKIYKVEKHIDIEGEDSEYNVSCHGTDIAVDGMYRIDAVDQDSEFTRLELLRSIWQVAAFPTSDSNYRYRFTPTLGGDAQVKLWVTCLGRLTNPAQGHTHSWTLTEQQVPDVRTGLVPGPASFDHAAGNCAAGEIAAQPGFDLTAPADGQIVPFRSYPAAANYRNWHWELLIGQSATTVTLYRSCLALKSSTVNGHAHRIVDQFRPGFGGSLRSLPVSDNRWDQDLHCGDHYKGMLGAWWIDDPFHVWWFGMEPRIKSRTYWFAWDGVGSNSVWVGLHCFKDKTT